MELNSWRHHHLTFQVPLLSEKDAKIKSSSDEIANHLEQMTALKDHIRSLESRTSSESSQQVEELQQKLTEMTALKEKSDLKAKMAVEKIKVS